MSENQKATQSPPIEKFREKNLSPIVRYFIEFAYAKQLYRAGWLRKNIPKTDVERVAGHTEGVTVLCTIIAQHYYPELNIDHIHKLSSFHELGESVTEDVIRDGENYIGMTKEEKKSRERNALKQMLSEFSIEIQNYYLAIYDELRDKTSPEAQFVDYIDKLETCFQALIYEYQYPDINLNNFFINVRAYITDPKLLIILDELESLRKK